MGVFTKIKIYNVMLCMCCAFPLLSICLFDGADL